MTKTMLLAGDYSIGLAVCSAVITFIYSTRSVWVKWYVQYLVRRAIDCRKYKDLLSDRAVPYGALHDSENDRYDDLSFLCLNARQNHSLHAAICRKAGRKCYVMLTLDINGVTYNLPGQATTYNNACEGFDSAGLTMSVLEEGARWRLTYSGPLQIGRGGAIVEGKLLLLWKVHTNLMDAFGNPNNAQTIAEYLLYKWKDGGMSFSSLRAAAEQSLGSTDSSTLQAGAFQGFVQIEGEETKLMLRGFKRHSSGETSSEDKSISSLEHLMVSQRGHYQYIRTSLSKDSSIPRQICSLKMYPNSEHAPADIRYVYPELLERVETRYGSTALDYSFDEPLTCYVLTDSQKGDRNSLLYGFPFQHKHPFISTPDQGRGLLLVNNVLQEGGGGWQVLAPKDLLPYKESFSRPLLATITSPAPVQDGNMSQPSDLLILLDHPDCKDSRRVGGKGSQLAVLYQADIDCCVPKAACLTVDAFNLQLEACPHLLELSSQLNQLADADMACVKELCDKLQQGILASQVHPKVRAAVESLLSGSGIFDEELRLAVRSSSIGEDGVDQSTAGQMDTILGVKGQMRVLEAVLQCWASYFSFTAVQYKRQHGQPLYIGMAVVIQEMVHAEAAGVLFTYDPVICSISTMVLNSNFGLGESVVSGVSEPDTFYIARSEFSTADKLLLRDKKVGRKEIQYLVDGSGEVTQQSGDHNSSFSITDEMALQLARIGLELEQGFGHPCDIEWAVCQGQIYLLQSRPITTLHLETQYELLHEFDSPLVMDHEMVSTMNIGEVIPEAVCPLTYSTVITCLEHSLQKYMWVLGYRCSAKAMIMIKIFCNRLFFNVHSVEVDKGRSLIANRRIMELALAGHTIDSMTDDEVKSYHHTVPFLDRLFNSIRFVYAIWTGARRCLAHKPKVNSMSLPDTANCMELMDYIEEALNLLQEVLIDDMPAASESAVCSQIIMGILTKGSEAWESRHYGDLASLLGCHLTNIESIGVPEGLEALAKLIKSHPEFSAKFCSVTASEGHELLKNDDAVRETYLSFMDSFGHRGVGELDVHHKSWSQNPAILVETLQSMVPHMTADHSNQHSTHIDDVISRLKSPLSNGEKRFIKYMLPKAKAAVNSREVCKSLIVKAVFNVKLAFWRLADLMHTQGYIPSSDLLFFLTHSEIYEVLNRRPGTHLSRAKRRSRVFEIQRSMKFARFSDGVPVPLEAASIASDQASETRGMPVSVGEVTGVARVVKSLAEANNIQKDEIMIVPYTDIGWTPFFPLVSGVITEQGGLVSHGAVVAREYGIPCVASCANATSLFNTGDLIRMNGTTGVITRLKPATDSSSTFS